MNAEDWLEICRRKSTDALLRDMRDLNRVESQALAPILAHLGEIDARGAALEKAFPSLFLYCVKELGYSEAEAYLRIRAARAARDYPRILSMVARGEIHVTAVARIARHLTADNYRSLLGKAGRRSQEELGDLLAELEAPEPEKRAVIRALPPQAPSAPPPEEGLFSAEVPEPAPLPAPEPRVLFNFVGRRSLRDKLRRAQEILRHKYPDGRPDAIFEDGLDALLDRKDPERRLARKRRRGVSPSP